MSNIVNIFTNAPREAIKQAVMDAVIAIQLALTAKMKRLNPIDVLEVIMRLLVSFTNDQAVHHKKPQYGINLLESFHKGLGQIIKELKGKEG